MRLTFISLKILESFDVNKALEIISKEIGENIPEPTKDIFGYYIFCVNRDLNKDFNGIHFIKKYPNMLEQDRFTIETLRIDRDSSFYSNDYQIVINDWNGNSDYVKYDLIPKSVSEY